MYLLINYGICIYHLYLYLNYIIYWICVLIDIRNDILYYGQLSGNKTLDKKKGTAPGQQLAPGLCQGMFAIGLYSLQ
jgi:hypothetical protein